MSQMTQEQFNNVIANVLAAKFIRLMNGQVRLTRLEIEEMCQFGFKIELENKVAPETSPLILTLISLDDARKLLAASLRAS